MIEFSLECIIRHFFLIPLRWRIRQILLYYLNTLKLLMKSSLQKKQI